MELLMVLGAIFSFIFWMVVGWRAMIAHERLAGAMEHLAPKFDARPVDF
ncbi:MAG: hypothetical protein WB919_05310 [Candidatus Sulfotelmatobacter sp.]